MFNSITKKLKGDPSPPKKPTEIEGFICPICMAAFVSPEMVQHHFNEKHPEDDNSTKSDPNVILSPTTQRKESIRDIQENLNDLRQSLDEEVWYNGELKKECTRLNVLVAERDQDMLNRDKVIEDYMKQISESEAAKDILNEELKKLQISKTSLMAENKTIRSDFRVCEEKLSELEGIRDELSELNERKSQENDHLFTELTTMKSVTNSDDERVSRLMEQLSESNHKLELNGNQLMSLSNELEKLKTEKEASVLEWETKCSNLSKYIEEQEAERSSVTESNERVASDYQSKLQSSTIECDELKKKIESLKLKLNATEDDATKMKRSLESDQSQNEDLSIRLKDSFVELQDVRSQNKELTQRIKNQEVDLLQIRNSCSNKDDEIKTLHKYAKTSSEQLNSLQQQLDIERQVKDDLLSKVEMTDAANVVMEQIQLEKKNLQENISLLKCQLEEETNRANNDLSTYRMEIQSLKEEILNLTSIVSEKEQTIKESEKISSDVQIVCEKYQQKVNEEVISRSSLEDQIMVLRREIQSKEESLNTSTESNLSLKKEHEVAIKHWEQERINAKADLTNLSKQVELVNLKASKVETLQHEIELRKTEISKLSEDLQRVSNERDSLLHDKASLQNNEEEWKIKLDTSIKLSQKLESLTNEKNVEIDSQLNIIKSRDSLIAELQTKILGNSEIINSLNEELASNKTTVASLRNDFDNMNEEIVCCRQSIEKYVAELTERGEEKRGLESEIMMIKENLLEKENLVTQLSQSKLHLENTCTEQEKVVDQLKEALDSLSSEKGKVEVQLSMAHIQIEETQHLYSESMKQQNATDNDLMKVSEEYGAMSKQLVDLEEEHSNLNLQYNTETEQLRKEGIQLKNRVTALEKTLNESSENYKQERLEATERELTLKSHCEELETNMVMLTKSLQRSEEDLESEKCLRQTERTNMMEKISQLTDLITEEEKLRNEFDQKLDSAETENIENKIRLDAARDEKDKLLEKIIQMENSLKKQNEGLTKKCREFDQLQSAILDLGRENQSLQITKEKITSRLWIVDDDAAQCHHCHKPFSLTHRKHHCRNCGQVFCQDCSMKTATLAVSRNPVRVCDGCHLEVHSHRRNSSTQSSNISLSLQN